MLRRPPLGHVLATAHDMGREHKIISALGPTDVPVAPALGLCTDEAVNGAPFYVMGFVDGLVLRDARAAEHDHRRAAPAQRERVDRRRRWPPSTPSTPTPSASATSARRRATSPASSSAGTASSSSRRRASCPVVDEVHDALAARIPEQGRRRSSTATTASTTA